MLNSKKQIIFTIILISFPVLFFILFELLLRLFNYSEDLSLFKPGVGDYAEYKYLSANVGKRYFSKQSVIPDPPNDIFFKVKPKNCYRIFILGGSTAIGFPYGNNLMFSRILQRRLADTFPDQLIEVINTATSAINSYALLDFMDEILAKDPNAILIYAGHNEYYGALGIASNESLGNNRWLIKLYLNLQRYKSFVLLRDLIRNIQQKLDSFDSKGTKIDPSATLMERLVADQQILYQSEVYELGKKQFEENLQDIVKKAKKAGVKVCLSELVSNIKDQRPFISIKTKNLPEASEIYDMAKKMELENRYEQAKELYIMAKDLDALRFRAPEEFNQIIHRVANEHDFPVVPMKDYFSAASINGIMGNELFLEHLHLNITGYFIMAEAFFETMRKNNFISSEWNSANIKPSGYYRQIWGYTELDSVYGDLCIRILKGGWPFHPSSIPNRSLLDYKPVTKAESLAVRIFLDKKYSFEDGHAQLADFYEKNAQYYLAFREYNALMFLVPYNLSAYLKAADVLIKGGELLSAFPILKKSLELEKTDFAFKWMGHILLENNELKEAIGYLEEAYKVSPEDRQILADLAKAYRLNNQKEKEIKILEKLSELDD